MPYPPINIEFFSRRLHTPPPPPLMCKWGSSYAELQDFEPLEDAIFYAEVFNPEVVPKMFFSRQAV